MVCLLNNVTVVISPTKSMELKERSDLLVLIDKYRLLREDGLMFYIRSRMEKVKSTCAKVKLTKEIDVLLRELPLKYDEHQRLR